MGVLTSPLIRKSINASTTVRKAIAMERLTKIVCAALPLRVSLTPSWCSKSRQLHHPVRVHVDCGQAEVDTKNIEDNRCYANSQDPPDDLFGMLYLFSKASVRAVQSLYAFILL
jgi:hypothetical protein